MSDPRFLATQMSGLEHEIDRLRAELATERATRERAELCIHMTVARLRGRVEGRPTCEINLLQRVDELPMFQVERIALARLCQELAEERDVDRRLAADQATALCDRAERAESALASERAAHVVTSDRMKSAQDRLSRVQARLDSAAAELARIEAKAAALRAALISAVECWGGPGHHDEDCPGLCEEHNVAAQVKAALSTTAGWSVS